MKMTDLIGKAGAGFKSLSDAWADTTTTHGRLMLTVLGCLAEFERELIRARTGEGREVVSQRQEAIQRLANGEAQADVARSFSHAELGIALRRFLAPERAPVRVFRSASVLCKMEHGRLREPPTPR
jgi:DNA invertase Pin-like site-specific DNA recombinase